MKSILLSFVIGAPKIRFEDLSLLEESSPNIILYALPVVAFFTLLEFVISLIQHRALFETKETIGSILVGTGNLVVNLFLKVLLLYGAVFIYNLVPWRMSFHWLTLLPCYILFDFCSYWSHRISHFNRFFWASHVVHHSGEHYNLTVSFRQSWVQHFKLLFFLPLAFAGFHPIVFFVTNQLAVLYQFWVHTEYIPKLHPLIEYIFATPSNHRVHHGSNPKYIDKNFAATFIIWDRIFHTYQEEEEKPIYGLTSPLQRKSDPFYLNFHEYADLIKDVLKARGLKRKAHFLFGRPSEIAQEKKQQLPGQS